MQDDTIEREKQKIENRNSWIGLATFCVAAVSAAFSIFAQGEAKTAAATVAEVEQQQQKVAQQLQSIQTSVGRGQARSELVQMAVVHLDKMISTTATQKRDRACEVARQLALIEQEDYTGSGTILRLHAVYSKQLSTSVTDTTDATQMCIFDVTNSVDQIELEGVASTPPAPPGLAESVVVLASYQSQNCKTALQAREDLQSFFADVPLAVALSGSGLYAVVYSPTQIGPSAQSFRSRARSAGVAAERRIVEGNSTQVDRRNLRFTADAFVAGTRGWELRERCPT
ncbi:MAG: hypothetical protein AAGF60_02765 [Pseudomonadota bacterium]